ncbi:MAG: serine/threonine protein kinase, partial [Lachnospiraceae bacterium]|nr:serine/threonine protein kinase [Lachnospiraceae bacterium]
MLKVGSLFAERYNILEYIAAGGMADVYKAEDVLEKRPVAIKILKPELSDDKEFVRRFKIEGQATSSLDCDNIVRVYDVGNVGDVYYIAMELIDGITLKQYIRRKGALSPRETMAIAAQVAVGLRAAHSHHVIHRDIKPQNIILSRDGKAKVTDFGIARAITDETRTLNVATMGSVHYIAPEQAKGLVCDERSDIYSLGICMYEMI